MLTKTYDKLKKEIKEELFVEFVFPVLRDIQDAEGEYRDEFVKSALKALGEKPIYAYNPRTFLRQIAYR